MASIISFFAGINRAVGDLLPPRAGDSIRDLIVGLETACDFSQFNEYLANFQDHEANYKNPHEVTGSFFVDELLEYIYQQYTYIASPVLSYDDWKAQYLYTADFLELIRRIVLNWYLYKDAYERGVGPLPTVTAVSGSALILDESQMVDISGDPVLEAQTIQPTDADGDQVSAGTETLSLTNPTVLVNPLVDGVGGTVSLNITKDWGVENLSPGAMDIIFPTWESTFTEFLKSIFNPQGNSSETPVFIVTNNEDVKPISYTQTGFPQGTTLSGAGVLTGSPTESAAGYWEITSVDAVGTTQTLMIQARTSVVQFLETTPDIIFEANVPGSTIDFDTPPVYNTSWMLPDPYLTADTSNSGYAYEPLATPLEETNFACYIRYNTDTTKTTARNLIKFEDAGSTTSLSIDYTVSGGSVSFTATYSRTGYADQQQVFPYTGYDLVIMVTKSSISFYGYYNSVIAMFGSFDLTSANLSVSLSTLTIGPAIAFATTQDCIEDLTLYPMSSSDIENQNDIAIALLSTQ